MSSPHQSDDDAEHTVSLGKNTPPPPPPSAYPPPQQQQQGYGPGAYGQQPYDPNTYGQQPYDPIAYGQQPYDPNAYGQQPYPAAGPYEQNPYGAYPQPGYGHGYPGYGQPYPASRGTNTMAILALVFGILVAPLGLVFGFVARSQIKKTGEDGDGLALAGIIIGGIFTLLFIAYIVFIIIFVTAVASTIPSGY
jgi:Domain of unknown function (DUF4190)